jgi:hypothetical protein
MPISLSFRNPVQVIIFSGGLSLAEDAALRLKLSEKINQGRLAILFQIEKFDIDDEGSRRRLLGLAAYCLESKVRLAFSGPVQSKWPLLVTAEKKKPEIFVSEAEAFAWFESQSQEAGDAPKSPTDNAEEQIKQAEIQDLLKRYEPFQNLNEFDPFHLEKLLQIYRKAPNRETIVELERAMRDLRKHHDRTAALKAEIEPAAKELLELTTYRKMPISPSEIAHRQAELKATQKDLLQEAQNLTLSLRDLGEQTKAFDLKCANLQYEKDQELIAWQKKVSEQELRNIRLKEMLLAAAASEQKLLDSLLAQN